MALNGCNSVGKLSYFVDITPNVTLEYSGYPLVYSNFPETFYGHNTAENKKYFYRDPNVTGRARVWFHHYNAETKGFYIVVRIRNRSSTSLRVYTNRIGSAAHQYSTYASLNAWYGWLTSSGSDVYRTSLAPGQFYDLIQLYVPSQYTAGGVVDYAVTDGSGRPAPVEVTVFAALYPNSITGAMMDTWGYDPNNNPSYSQPSYGAQVRGTFPHCSRSAMISIPTYPYHSNRIIIGENPVKTVLKNEYERGWDYAQNCSVWVNGNFGVDYNLTFQIDDRTTRKGTVYGYLQDDGFPNLYLIRDDGAIGSCNKSNKGVAWHFDTSYTGNQILTKKIWYTLLGGNYSPIQLHWA